MEDGLLAPLVEKTTLEPTMLTLRDCKLGCTQEEAKRCAGYEFDPNLNKCKHFKTEYKTLVAKGAPKGQCYEKPVAPVDPWKQVGACVLNDGSAIAAPNKLPKALATSNSLCRKECLANRLCKAY